VSWTELTDEPEWLIEAHLYIGQRKLPDVPVAPALARWLQRLGAQWGGDEVPWCGPVMAAWMQACDIPPARAWYRAKGWLDWGTPIPAPVVGAVVVFDRAGGGHVGLVVGKDPVGRLLVLGGNEGSAVSVLPFDRARVAGYRWPPGQRLPRPAPLPVIASSGPFSGHRS
jgi:uncharacterized protein (TIGR02594 family)